jgi:hypothetical protein
MPHPSTRHSHRQARDVVQRKVITVYSDGFWKELVMDVGFSLPPDAALANKICKNQPLPGWPIDNAEHSLREFFGSIAVADYGMLESSKRCPPPPPIRVLMTNGIPPGS